MREVVAVSVLWIVLILVVLFFVWAAWKLRGRDVSSGPEARGDRHRRTGTFMDGN